MSPPTPIPVVVYGPNLPAHLTEKGEFHVHAGSCAAGDFVSSAGLDAGRYDTVAVSRYDIVLSLFADIIEENLGVYYDTIEAGVRTEGGQVWFAPCLKDLPAGAELPAAQPTPFSPGTRFRYRDEGDQGSVRTIVTAVYKVAVAGIEGHTSTPADYLQRHLDAGNIEFLPAPCYGETSGEGYSSCDRPGGCPDCRAIAAHLQDGDQLTVWGSQ